MRCKVIESEDYLVEFEEWEGLTFVHCTVHSWSKAIKQQLQYEFNILRILRGASLYALHDIGDSKHLKFLSYFGFEYLQDIQGLDGVTRQVFITGN